MTAGNDQNISTPERYKPTISIEDGYLKIGIPLGALALALRNTDPEDRNGLLLTLGTTDKRTDSEETRPDLIFASGLCMFSESGRDLQVLDQTIHLNPQEFLVLRALARQVNRPVHYETLIGEVYSYDYPNEYASHSRLKVIQNRVSSIGSKAVEALSELGEGNTKIIKRIHRMGYMLPDQL